METSSWRSAVFHRASLTGASTEAAPIDRPLTSANPGVAGFLPDGKLVLGSFFDSDLVDAASGTTIDNLDGIEWAKAASTAPVVFGFRSVSRGRFGDFVAYDTSLKRDTLTLRLPAGQVGTYAVSPNDAWAVVGLLSDTGLDVWRVDIAGGKFSDPVVHFVQTVDKNGGLDRDSYTAGITNDGEKIFVGDIDFVRIYDATTGTETGEPLKNNFIILVTDKYLLTTGAGIIVRDLANLAVVATLTGAGSVPVQYAVSAEGRMLQVLAFNTETDASVALYDLNTFARIGEPMHLDGPAVEGDIRPDGLEMALGSGAGTSIWDLDSDHWATAACALAGQNLTQQEWDTYLLWTGTYRETCPSS